MTIYLDNAATTYPKPEPVYLAIMHALREIGASPGRGGYRRSLEAGRLLFQARETIASLFAIPDSSRVIFTHSATEALNLALRGILVPGDHVVTTSMEHNSLLRPLFLLRQQGVEVTIVEADGEGSVDPDDIRRAVRGRTRMVAVGHVSNVTGTVQDIVSLARISREAGALFLLDAAQSVGSEDIDVVRDGIDILAAPGHKGLFGPQGTGFLYAAQNVTLRPLLAGGTGSSSDSEEQPDTFPEGFEAGTHNLPGISGLKAGVEFVLHEGTAAIRGREGMLTAQLKAGLATVPGLVLHGPADTDRCGNVVSFTVKGADPSQVAFDLDRRYGIAVRAGLHCAPRAHRTIGTHPAGTVRVSPGYFSTREDIDIFCNAIVECIKLLSK